MTPDDLRLMAGVVCGAMALLFAASAVGQWLRRQQGPRDRRHGEDDLYGV